MEETLTQLIAAIQSRAWYPALALGVTLLIAVWRVVQPAVWDKIPSKYKPVPALILTALTAFVTAFQSGEHWTVAVGIAIYTIFSVWPTSLGAAEVYLRLFKKEVEKLSPSDPPVED